MQRNLVLGGVLDCCHDVGDASRSDDAQRPNLVDARVRSVHLHKDVVTAHVTIQ
jgi:hypothetical protein